MNPFSYAVGIIALLQPALFDAARRLQEQGRYSEAEVKYREVLRTQPGSIPALTNLGVVLARQSKFAAAIGAYRKVLDIDPSLTAVRGNIALAYYQAEDWDNAAGWFTQVLDADRTDRRTRQLLAICNVQRRHYEEAAKLFEGLLPSDDPSILIGSATSYIETGRVQDATYLLEKLLILQPGTPSVLFLVGLAHYAREKYPEAAGSFRQMLDKFPESAEGRFYLGAACFKQNDPDTAVVEWRKVVQANRSYFPAVFSLGTLLSVREQYKEAQELLERAQTLRPDSVPVEYELGRLAYNQGNYQEALKRLSRAAKLDPRSRQTGFLLANTLRRMGREREALDEFQRSRRLDEEASRDTVDQALDKNPKP